MFDRKGECLEIEKVTDLAVWAIFLKAPQLLFETENSDKIVNFFEGLQDRPRHRTCCHCSRLVQWGSSTFCNLIRNKSPSIRPVCVTGSIPLYFKLSKFCLKLRIRLILTELSSHANVTRTSVTPALILRESFSYA